MSFHPIPHARRLRDRAGRVCKSRGAPEKNHVEFSKGNQVMPRKLASPEGVAALTTKRGETLRERNLRPLHPLRPLGGPGGPPGGGGDFHPKLFPYRSHPASRGHPDPFMPVGQALGDISRFPEAVYGAFYSRESLPLTWAAPAGFPPSSLREARSHFGRLPWATPRCFSVKVSRFRRTLSLGNIPRALDGWGMMSYIKPVRYPKVAFLKPRVRTAG